MEVISLCSLPVAALLWSTEQRGWSLTVIAKATFDLVPGELSLASDQIPILRADRHWDDEPNASVWAPSDMAPFKSKVDVVLVGHAYSPGKLPRASLIARLDVAGIDKQLVVRGTRIRDAKGEIGPAASFRRLPIRYERALAPDEQQNPAGVPADGRPNDDGTKTLPNIEPAPGRDAVEPLGMGPVPATWPARVGKLGRHAEDWSHDRWFEAEIPRELDLGFFNVAPADQQIEALKTGDVLHLENLHPKYAGLTTRLPALKPLAYVERAGAEPELLTLRCDTLWIDTDAQTCTLTWRGQLRLSGPRESARCLVLLSESGDNIAWDEVEQLRQSVDVPAWIERAPESITDGALDLAETGKHRPAKGRQLHVSVVAGPIMEPAPRSLEGSYLSSRDVETIPPDDEEGTLDEADLIEDSSPWSRRHRMQLTKILWHDREAVKALAVHPDYKPLVAGRPPLRDEVENAQRLLHTVIHHVEPADAPVIEATLVQATEREPFEAPMIVSAGVLSPSYDAVARLKATVTTVTPFASDDEVLHARLAAAHDLLSLPWLATADGIAEELVVRLIEAFERPARALPPDFAGAQVTRILVQERHFVERELWGRRWIRCDFTPAGARSAIPAYLPVEAKSQLPAAPRLDTRIVGVVDVREDAYETHPLCLRIAGLARYVEG